MLTISLENKEGIFETQKIYLHDKKVNFYHNLSQSDYFFYPDETSNRFEIVYQLNSTNDEIEEDIFNIQASIINSNFVVSSSLPIAKIDLYDIKSRLIFGSSLDGEVFVFEKNINLSKGVYIINITTLNGEKKKVKILNQN